MVTNCRQGVARGSVPDLGGLLPRGIAAARSGTGGPEPPLPPLEARRGERFAPTRRRDFAVGRHCARTALSALGVDCDAIGVGSGGEPLWPSGTVGSISHCDDHAVAVAALSRHYRSVGLDIERAASLEPAVTRLVCRPEEVDDPGNDCDGIGESVLFSVKESIYKCLWPLHRRYVDFRDVVVRLCPKTGGISARSVSETLPAEWLQSLQGRYAVRDGYVLSVAWIAP